MNDERLGKLYHAIAETVLYSIPGDWYKVYVYGEVVEGSQSAYFYYYYEGSEQPVYCHDIPEQYGVSEMLYTKQWNQLLDLMQELQSVFKENEQEPWTNLTFIFDQSGKFHIDFHYDDLSKTDSHERKTIWKYKHLGIVPKSNSGKRYLEKYFETVEGMRNEGM